MRPPSGAQRDDINPARIADLRAVLGTKRPKVKHHPALPWKDRPAFMRLLRLRPEVASLALQFTVLTAARTTEVLAMT